MTNSSKLERTIYRCFEKVIITIMAKRTFRNLKKYEKVPCYPKYVCDYQDITNISPVVKGLFACWMRAWQWTSYCMCVELVRAMDIVCVRLDLIHLYITIRQEGRSRARPVPPVVYDRCVARLSPQLSSASHRRRPRPRQNWNTPKDLSSGVSQLLIACLKWSWSAILICFHV